MSRLSDSELVQQIVRAYSGINQAAVDAQHFSGLLRSQAATRQKQRMAAADAAKRASLLEIQTRFDQTTKVIADQLQAVQNLLGLAAMRWDPDSYRAWRPLATASIPPALRLGQLTETVAGQTLHMPGLVGFPLQRPLLLIAGGDGRATAVAALQSLLLRMLVGTPSGQLRFTLLDPLGLGHNVAALMHLADHDDQLVTSRAWTESRHIEQRLVDLTEHIENVIQKYLRDQYPTIEAYNEQAGEIAEPYRTLAVFDFPVNFSQDAARRLLSIAQSGPRCGVMTVILYDPGQPAPHGFNVADLQRISDTIAWDGKRFVWQDDDFRSALFTLDTPPEPALAAKIVEAVGKTAKASAHVEVPFERIALPPDRWWQESSLSTLTVPLGPSGARAWQRFEVGTGTTHNALIAGRVGSGKSTLLHTLIANLALTYSPDEIELYLIDFKEGVEFKTYAARQLPHARVIAIESEREFGLSVLQGLDTEIVRRGDLFKATADRLGVEIPNIAAYRTRSGETLPRILLVVDEFQKLFAEDDSLASQAANVLENVVRTGRAFGIHVVLASQTLAGTPHLNRAILGQMAIRIALQCSDADSRLILADDNPAARLLSRPGEAIYNAANGMLEGNGRFQVAWLSDDVRDAYLEQVRQLAEAREFRPRLPQIVFEGTAPADVAKNVQLATLIQRGEWASAPRGLQVWLGEPVAIREPVSVTFGRQTGSNLLIVGQEEEAALGVTAMTIVSLAARLAGRATTGTHDSSGEPARLGAFIEVLDFGAAEGANAEVFTSLADALPTGLIRVGRRRQLSGTLGRLSADVRARLAAEDEGDSHPTPPRVLVLFGLQRARDLRPDDGFSLPSFSLTAEPNEPAPSNPSQDLATILRDGPDVGVHTIVWCDTVTNLNRGIDRRAQREFGLRLAFQMSPDDSSALIDSTAASKIGRHRALLLVEDEGRLEKVRPYALPDPTWLEWVGAQLRARELPADAAS